MKIKESIELDIKEISKVHKLAFGEKEGTEILELIENLFKDETAKPIFSFIATDNEKTIGHVLFTNIKIIGKENSHASILAPLAVLPKFQKKGVGTKLIETGFKELKKQGTDFVFTYGDPKFYSKFGFKSASKLNIIPPQKIPSKNKDAWMIKKLNNTKLENVKVKCANSLKYKKYW